VSPLIGVARGAVGAPAPPGRKKIFRRNLQGKCVSAPTSQSNFLGQFLVGGLDLEVYLDGL